MAKAGFAVAVWGASFVATKVALRDMTPVALVWARFAMGVLVLGAIVAARRQFRAVPARDLAYFLLLGFLGITLHQWLQSNGLVTSQATTTGWIVATSPLFIALFGRIFLGERLGKAAIAGILIAAFGVLLVVARGDPRAIAVRLGAPGDVLILISAVNWAVFSVISRRGLKRHAAALMMFYVMLLGWILTTALFAAESGFRGIGHPSGSGLAALCFLGILCSGVAYVFWFDALERLPASRVGSLLYLEPLVTVAVAAGILGEAVRFGTMAGGAIILFGIWLVNRERGDA
ncbi:MAG TPA: DMT family transporter [Candidatus Limnocylindrales bacterium]|nr:DMT family transporter [Candidatus Limnocylindrales bacterium]